MPINNSPRLLLEANILAALEQASEARENLIEQIPYEELYTSAGEINRDSRWGATLWTINQFIANIRNLGF